MKDTKIKSKNIFFLKNAFMIFLFIVMRLSTISTGWIFKTHERNNDESFQ